MKRAGSLVFLGLLLSSAAAGADPAGCGIRRGLYEEWLSLEKRGNSPRKVLKLLGGPKSAATGTGKGQTIGEEYQAFFQCLSDAANRKEDKLDQSLCPEATMDRLGAMVCRTVAYIKGGRTASKEFVDAIPGGRKGGEMIWDLDAIADSELTRQIPIFQPRGPAYKAIDELFVLVLDDNEMAVSKYFNIYGAAAEPGARYMDEKIKVLLLEAPAVVVKEWSIVRQSLPRIKKLLTDMAAALPPADIRKMRLGVAGFCTKDNLDCPEILKTFGKPE